MKRVCCVYFSPTGGTELVARTVAQAMAETLGLPLEYFDITLPKAREQTYSFGAENVLVLATPTYAGRVPNKMLPELERLLNVERGCRAVVLSVYGGRSNDEGLRELALLAENRGAEVMAAAACVVRHSMSKVLAAHRPAEKDLEELRAFGRNAAAKLLAPEAKAAEFDRESPIAPYYKPFKEDMSPAVFLKAKPLTRDSCIDCGLCAELCPMGIISFEDFRTVSGACIKCHACVRKCPVEAKYFADEELLSHIRVLEKLFEGRQDNLYIL